MSSSPQPKPEPLPLRQQSPALDVSTTFDLSAVQQPPPGKLFVGGLSWQTTAAKLQEYFGVFGAVSDVMIMRDPVTQHSRGFGFVTFARPASAQQVLQMPTHILDGKRIDPKHATPHQRTAGPPTPNVLSGSQPPELPPPPPPATSTSMPTSSVASVSPGKMFVGGISQETSADELDQYFRQFGPVAEVVLPMDQQTRRHRGFGFVTFVSAEVVDRLCADHYHTIKAKRVECKRAQPRSQPASAAGLLGALQVPAATISAKTTAAVAAAAAASQEFLQSVLANELASMQTMLADGYAGGTAQTIQQQQHRLQRIGMGRMAGTNGYPGVNAGIESLSCAKSSYMHYAPAVQGFGKLVIGQQQQQPMSRQYHQPSTAHGFRYSPYSVPIRGVQQLSETAQSNGENKSTPSSGYPAYEAASMADGGSVEDIPANYAGVDWNGMYGMGSGMPY